MPIASMIPLVKETNKRISMWAVYQRNNQRHFGRYWIMPFLRQIE